jgi:hypothetical protein
MAKHKKMEDMKSLNNKIQAIPGTLKRNSLTDLPSSLVFRKNRT